VQQGILARITPCLENGKTAFVDILDDDEAATGSTEFLVLSATEDILPKFVYYTARRPDVRQFAIKRMTGSSGRQRVPTDVFDDLTIKVPPIEEQRKIVDFLDAIDTKIEVNHEMADTIEEACEAIYEEKFSDLEENGYLTDISEIVLGGTPDKDKSEYWGDDMIWAKAKDVSQSSYCFLTEPENSISAKGLEESSTEVVPEGTTTVVARGSLGELVMNGREMAINQTCYGLVPKKEFDKYFLYFTTKKYLHELLSRSHGTVFDTVTKRTLNEQKIAIPENEVRQEYHQQVHPLMEKARQGIIQNTTLKEMRDTLLPKLMNGEVILDA
jgi:type I restriction enzyme S subunit